MAEMVFPLVHKTYGENLPTILKYECDKELSLTAYRREK